MSKHTAGPWEAVEVGDTGGENPMPVYEVQTADGHKRICEYIRPDDARLCAAATELLEACEAAQRIFDGGPIKVSREYVAELAMIRAAIRKAKGE